MKIPYSWINKFLPLEITAEEAAKTLTSIGIETSVVSDAMPKWTNVWTAKVISTQKHPNADKLSLCKVSDGANEFSIVCGASNVSKGLIVALAKIGAVLPGNFEIKKSKIRGIESEGMLCSQKELGLSLQSEGIMELDAKSQVGIPLEQIFEENDPILEVEVTPNRGDCLNVLGISRELAAKLEKTISPILPKVLPAPSSNKVHIDSTQCLHYIGAIISGVKIAPSPKWLASSLEKCGIRSINNVVDITNYVMMELGQPLHAFDISKLSEQKVIVRLAKSGEKLTALDGKVYELDGDMLIIADDKKPVAIAGVMGGEFSGIDDKTTEVFLESAVFNASSVRKTSKKLKLSSDSSYRFERGIDPLQTQTASLRAINLIISVAGGKLISRDDVCPSKYKDVKIFLRWQRVKKVLGYEIAAKEIEGILKGLCFKVTSKADGLECIVPSWRNDVKDEIDLIEEIVRINGYENIPQGSTQNSSADAAKHQTSFFLDIAADLRRRLYGIGFCEAVNYSFSEIEELKKFGLLSKYKIANPLSKENEVLRPSLLPALYKNLLNNLAQGFERIALFEYGKVFTQDGEKNSFAILMYGNVWDEWWKIEVGKNIYDFYYGGGLVKSLLPKGVLIDKNLSPQSYYHPSKTASIMYRGKPAGHFGIVHPLISKDLHSEVVYCEFDLDLLSGINLKDVSFKPFAKFPPVKRDISVIADKSLPFAKIENVIKNIMKTGKILKEYVVFSVYQNEQKIGAGKVGYSLRLLYKDASKTLTDIEVNADMQTLLGKLEKELGVVLRT
ncbi:MAG: phenylalanine--tRNA ligase subunit beta [Elusimicrobiota bacterium]|jgi:phenylalanyl-tRNA synthetase beta chain|nr:phenylalanine--tRNA ligase subunit beta [Elusimicrobiota bacterium]